MTVSELASQFHELFEGLERAHGFWENGDRSHNGKVKGKARTVQTPVTDALWERHLSGTAGIGIVPIRDDGTCLWGAIDIDVYDGLDHAELEQQVESIGAPLLILRSKSGGAHLYMFTNEPVPANLIQQRLRECAMALGHPRAEVFPKQTELDGDNGIGNWINMPYQNVQDTVRHCIRKGQVLTATEFLALAQENLVTLDQLKALQPRAVTGDEWADAPPCLQFLVLDGFPEGSRNNALMSLAVFAKKVYPEGEWQNKVFEYNQKWMNGAHAEVTNIIRSASKKDYQYKCSDVPLCNHCNKSECGKRKYGIKSGRASKESSGPSVLDEVDRPVKVFRPVDDRDDEPQWVFTIAGKKLDVTLDMLYNQKLFLRAYTKKFERVRMEIPADRWQSKVNDLLAEAEVLELPPDAGPEGQLMLHLEAFCTGKAQARDKAELVLGRPWTDDDNVTWFRSRDFVKFCDQHHFRAFREAELWAVFRRHGGKNHRFMIKGQCVGAWGFPAFAKQTEDFDPVAIPETEEKGAPF